MYKLNDHETVSYNRWKRNKELAFRVGAGEKTQSVRFRYTRLLCPNVQLKLRLEEGDRKYQFLKVCVGRCGHVAYPAAILLSLYVSDSKRELITGKRGFQI